MKDKIMVSIIIPIYNAEKYISKCLDSLINQTYKEIEIICVNDGSKDNSERIIKEYVKKDNRIQLISQKNQGGIVARKNGFEKSKGEYCLIIDSDDWLDLNTIECLVNKINEYYEKRVKLDFIRFGYIIEPKKECINYINCKERLYSDNDIKVLFKDLICGDKLNSIWNVFFRKEVLRFDDSIFDYMVHKAEDLEINMSIYQNLQTVLFVSDNFYHYFQNPKGITKTANINKIRLNIKDYMYLYDRRVSLNNKYKLSVSENIFKNIFINGILCEVIKLLRSNKVNKNDFYDLDQYIIDIRANELFNGYNIKEFKYGIIKKYFIKCILKNKLERLYKFCYILKLKKT